jgi:hypothetical protein
VAPGSPAPGSDWVRALEKRAVLARGGEHGTPLCLLTTADELELWNTDDDALLGRLDVGAVDELAAVSTGCVTRSGSSVQLHALDGSTRHLSADARAIALDGDQILVATDAQLTAFDHKGVGGESVGIGPATTALARVGEWLVLGFEDGNVERHRPGDASQRSALPFTSTASSAVVRMVAAPPGTVVVGYANGHVGLWSVDNGSLLHSARLHGPVSHLRVVGGQLVAGENMSRHTRFLAKVHGFDTLDRRGRRAFADRMRESTYGTGQYILKKGDRPADST